jgi:GTP cyclohydrolase I
VQERMTVQIANELMEVLETQDVAVIIDARHLCVASRGIKDISSATVTSSYHGKFNDPQVRAELLKYIEMNGSE